MAGDFHSTRIASFGGRQFVAAFVCAALSSNRKNLKNESCLYLFICRFHV